MPRTLVLLLLVHFSLVAAGSCKQGESLGMPVGKDYAFDHDGMERSYKMYRPEKLAHNAPLVFVLHGMTSNSAWSYLAGFNELAEEHGFLAVYPQSHLKLIQFDGGDGKSGKKADMSWLGEKANSCKEGESFMANGLEIVCKDGVLTPICEKWRLDLVV
jgi:poly(3-hydroxybutyrate) depolymerase